MARKGGLRKWGNSILCLIVLENNHFKTASKSLKQTAV
jgi:hypothetical protein